MPEHLMMIMTYKYPWRCAIGASALLLFIFYWWDVEPLLNQITTQCELEQKLRYTLFQSESQETDNESSLSATVVLNQNFIFPDRLFTLAHVCGMEMRSIKRISKQANSEMWHILVRADFDAWVKFLSLLQDESPLVLISDFSLKVDGYDKLAINADVIIKKEIALAVKHSQSSLQTVATLPFCPALHELRSGVYDDNAIHQLPLSAILMSGYLQQASRVCALLSLPSGAVIDIAVGALIGKEHAMVTKIYPDHLVAVSQGKTYNLPLSREHGA